VLNQAREMVEKLHGLGQLLINGINETYELNAARSVEYTCQKISSTAMYVTGTVTVRNRRHTVSMGEVTCTCKMWDLLGYPCAHAIAAASAGLCISILFHRTELTFNYVAPLYVGY